MRSYVQRSIVRRFLCHRRVEPFEWLRWPAPLRVPVLAQVDLHVSCDLPQPFVTPCRSLLVAFTVHLAKLVQPPPSSGHHLLRQVRVARGGAVCLPQVGRQPFHRRSHTRQKHTHRLRVAANRATEQLGKAIWVDHGS